MLDLKVQYFQDSPPAGRPYREEHFIRRHVQMELPVKQTALVLVDLWDNHFIESWLERAARITRAAVVPVLERARQTGLTIVHAPSPPIAEHFDQLKQHAPPLPVAVSRRATTTKSTQSSTLSAPTGQLVEHALLAHLHSAQGGVGLAQGLELPLLGRHLPLHLPSTPPWRRRIGASF